MIILSNYEKKMIDILTMPNKHSTLSSLIINEDTLLNEINTFDIYKSSSGDVVFDLKDPNSVPERFSFENVLNNLYSLQILIEWLLKEKLIVFRSFNSSSFTSVKQSKIKSSNYITDKSLQTFLNTYCDGRFYDTNALRCFKNNNYMSVEESRNKKNLKITMASLIAACVAIIVSTIISIWSVNKTLKTPISIKNSDDTNLSILLQESQKNEIINLLNDNRDLYKKENQSINLKIDSLKKEIDNLKKQFMHLEDSDKKRK